MEGTSLREGLALGVIAALVWAMPAALRTPAPALTFVVLAGMGALVLAPVVAFGRVAWAQMPASVTSLGTALGLSVLPLVVLAYGLLVATHHRGLGGATFGLVGAAIVGGAIVAVRRCERVGSEGMRRWLGLSLRVLAALGVLGLIAVAARPGAGGVRVGLADAGVALVATVLVMRLSARAPGYVHRWGWVGLPVLGVAALGLMASQPELVRTSTETAPVVFSLGFLFIAR